MTALPEQEESLELARKIKQDLYEEDIHYRMSDAAWEKIVLDLVGLITDARKDTGNPPAALPGTLRSLLYGLKEIVMNDDALLDGEVIVAASLGDRPVLRVEQCNFTTNLVVDGEFWDPDIHPGLLIDLDSPGIREHFTAEQIEWLASEHDQNLEAETGR